MRYLHMRHLLTFIAALLLSSSGVLADIDNFEDIINEHGYDPATVNDLSDSAKSSWPSRDAPM